MIHTVAQSYRRIACTRVLSFLSALLVFSGCASTANSLTNPLSQKMRASCEVNNLQAVHIPTPLSGGHIVLSSETSEENSRLCVTWRDDKALELLLWESSNYILDPEQEKPWFLLSHRGVEYFALSVFSGGARCCWEILLFRLDEPQIIKRGFTSVASPLYRTDEKNCFLAAKIYPISRDEPMSWKSKIECLVDEITANE
ncbi:hypothetical protein MJO47_04450 [Desulfuromonas sp. KJ2020]|uniref:hypothetical protein n=1 Tax=Desulfuromonas sp. KJ2020 TaxID=2919173 RepID=UPI0020A74659|nr:hypothetical protein [Desulfuromonas sp. KJ2020]MCP3176344.1 hypothetical protein [Desulfuromonas sp. KJ2020]